MAASVDDLASRLRHAVVPAVPVPFDGGGDIDLSRLRSYARWMRTQRVGAVAVGAHTGRGLRMSPEDRELVLREWTATLGDVPVVAGVGVPSEIALPASGSALTDTVVAATVEMARRAREMGASALLVHPPTVLRDLPDVADRVIELHQAVSEVGLPMLAFHLYREAGGVPYDPALVDRLLGTRGVLGIKLATLDSVTTYQDLVGVARGHTGSLIVTGEDRFLGYSLMIGADAALVGIAAACTDVVARLLDTWFDGELERFVRLAAAVDRFAQITFADPVDGYVQRMLWALVADGVLEDPACDKFAPELERDGQARVMEAVRALRDA